MAHEDMDIDSSLASLLEPPSGRTGMEKEMNSEEDEELLSLLDPDVLAGKGALKHGQSHKASFETKPPRPQSPKPQPKSPQLQAPRNASENAAQTTAAAQDNPTMNAQDNTAMNGQSPADDDVTLSDHDFPSFRDSIQADLVSDSSSSLDPEEELNLDESDVEDEEQRLRRERLNATQTFRFHTDLRPFSLHAEPRIINVVDQARSSNGWHEAIVEDDIKKELQLKDPFIEEKRRPLVDITSRGEGYDAEDPFIDDTDFYDAYDYVTVVPLPARKGYFVTEPNERLYAEGEKPPKSKKKQPPRDPNDPSAPPPKKKKTVVPKKSLVDFSPPLQELLNQIPAWIESNPPINPKAKVPDPLKEVFLAAARLAVTDGVYNDDFVDFIASLLPYTANTVRKHLTRDLYDFRIKLQCDYELAERDFLKTLVDEGFSEQKDAFLRDHSAWAARNPDLPRSSFPQLDYKPGPSGISDAQPHPEDSSDALAGPSQAAEPASEAHGFVQLPSAVAPQGAASPQEATPAQEPGPSHATLQQPETPVSERPVAEPPAAGPPVTEPPVAERPVAEPPAAGPPVTEPPVAERPVAEPPAAGPPAAGPPVAEPPVSERPVAERPAAERPAAEPPVAEPPATEPPAAEPPVSELPAAGTPIAEHLLSAPPTAETSAPASSAPDSNLVDASKAEPSFVPQAEAPPPEDHASQQTHAPAETSQPPAGSQENHKPAEDASSPPTQETKKEEEKEGKAEKKDTEPQPRYKLSSEMRDVLYHISLSWDTKTEITEERNKVEATGATVNSREERKAMFDFLMTAFPPGWMDHSHLSRELSTVRKRYVKPKSRTKK